ncbi:unnamed protein product [Protopolystoma xenopodis]|uniref:Uncharacterized protein n=1 Tax=Protopolystoma xenopodis TaxID=117903 RepID=A0A3S5AX17_9PLAT|nr:unnamed protein product [Protopolystoma xenopodis]
MLSIRLRSRKLATLWTPRAGAPKRAGNRVAACGTEAGQFGRLQTVSSAPQTSLSSSFFTERQTGPPSLSRLERPTSSTRPATDRQDSSLQTSSQPRPTPAPVASAAGATTPPRLDLRRLAFEAPSPTDELASPPDRAWKTPSSRPICFSLTAPGGHRLRITPPEVDSHGTSSPLDVGLTTRRDRQLCSRLHIHFKPQHLCSAATTQVVMATGWLVLPCLLA